MSHSVTRALKTPFSFVLCCQGTCYKLLQSALETLVAKVVHRAMASISDVAAKAEVSPTTVSHALSGKRRVSPAVKARVEAAMKSLGYVPSRSAQNLALGNTRIIALVVPDIGNSYFAELAKGVEATAVDHGYNVILCTTGFDQARERQYLQMIHSRTVDGIVYAAGAPPTNSELTDLLGDMPLVFVDQEIEGTVFTSMVSDNEAGGVAVAEHLLALGHRTALIVDAAGDPATSVRRVRGFRETWLARGGHEPLITHAGYTEEEGRAAITPHIGAIAAGEVTTLFALNDLMALGIINELQAAGLSIPRDVSVVGFDDIIAGRYSNPGLTTIRQPVRDLGISAATTLITALKDDRALSGRQQVFPVELVVRESTAPRRTSGEAASA